MRASHFGFSVSHSGPQCEDAAASVAPQHATVNVPREDLFRLHYNPSHTHPRNYMLKDVKKLMSTVKDILYWGLCVMETLARPTFIPESA
ncbi:hypothetical protein CIB48_g4128 [Xylaria polymorpha]|nr:hypothetical protein CIB48_g4128 [Xylaria polymorpha]